MFFDNARYFAYLDLCRAAGITVPIVPGLKILTGKAQLASIPRNFFVDIPAELSDEVLAAEGDEVTEVGVRWAERQALELLDRGVPALHFYVMQNSKAVMRLLDRLEIPARATRG